MTKKPRRQPTRVPNEVLFITSSATQLGLSGVTPGEGLTRTLEAVKEDWTRISSQVIELVSATASRVASSGYEPSEVSISLGFNAKGKLAFIAEAGVESSITISFKRHKP